MNETARRDEPEHRIVRIKGDVEDWLRDFLETELRAHKGKLYGACIHLCVLSDDGETVGTRAWYDWPSKAQMIGQLQTSIVRLSLEISDQKGPS